MHGPFPHPFIPGAFVALPSLGGLQPSIAQSQALAVPNPSIHSYARERAEQAALQKRKLAQFVKRFLSDPHP